MKYLTQLSGVLAASMLIFMSFISLNIKAQNIAICDDDNYTADPSAMLDVKSEAKGLLIPRLTTVQRTAIDSPAEGLLVFDTDIDKFYFFDGVSWKMIEAEYVEADPNSWSKLGNAGTVDGINFIGTTDNVALNFRVNNQKAGIITSNGNMFFGYQSGNVYTTGTSNTGIGHRTLFSTSSSHGNTAIGTNALENNTADRNTAVGFTTMQFNTTGQWNTAIGSGALLFNTSGSYNIAIGGVPLQNNLSGSANIAVGGGALLEHQSGNENIAIGMYSLKRNFNGLSNVAVGIESGYNNINGSGNVFIGYKAGYNETGSNKLYIANSSTNTPLIYGDFSTGKVGIGTTTPVFRLDVLEDAQFNGVRVGRGGGTGIENTAVGAYALLNSTTGYSNTSIGFNSMNSNTTGYANTVVGQQAMAMNINGHFNSAFGCQSLLNNTDGNSNTAFGLQSIWGNTTGSNNTAIGRDALLYSTTGNNNVALGQEAGRNIGSGSSNVFIGYQAGYNETGSDKLYIANSSTNTPLIYGDFASSRVGIGTSNPFVAFEVNGSIFASGSSATPSSGTGLEVLYHTGVDAAILQSYNYTTSSEKPLRIIADPILLMNGNVGVGTTITPSRLSVGGGDINIIDIGSGVIMKSPDGNCWRVTVDNMGNFVSTAIACP